MESFTNTNSINKTTTTTTNIPNYLKHKEINEDKYKKELLKNENENNKKDNYDIGWEELDPKKYIIFNSLVSLVFDGSLYPADVIKTRLQTQGVMSNATFPKYSSTTDAFIKIIKLEGIKGLFRGFSAQAAGSVPTQVLFFSSYECSKHYMNVTYNYLSKKYQNLKNFNQTAEVGIDLMAGAIAEIGSAIIWIPVDIITQKLQIQGPKNHNNEFPKYNGAIDVVKKIIKSEGISGLYRGIVPTIATYAPASGFLKNKYYNKKKSCSFC
jgi:solute carrier family 25 protein 44